MCKETGSSFKKPSRRHHLIKPLPLSYYETWYSKSSLEKCRKVVAGRSWKRLSSVEKLFLGVSCQMPVDHEHTCLSNSFLSDELICNKRNRIATTNNRRFLRNTDAGTVCPPFVILCCFTKRSGAITGGQVVNQ